MKKFIFAYSIIFILLILTTKSHADDIEIFNFTGGEIDTKAQGYAYTGLGLIKEINNPFSVGFKVTGYFLTYEYRSNNQLIRAKASGVNSLLGVVYKKNETFFGIWGGIDYRDTNLKPDLPNQEIRGSDVSGIVQFDFDKWFQNRYNISVFTSFSGIDNFVYERFRIKKQVTNLNFQKKNTINLGIEQLFGRNDDFYRVGGGVVVELFNLPNWLALALRMGYSYDSTFNNELYWGIEFFKRF